MIDEITFLKQQFINRYSKLLRRLYYHFLCLQTFHMQRYIVKMHVDALLKNQMDVPCGDIYSEETGPKE